MGLECPEEFARDRQEECSKPIAVILLAITVLGLAVVWRRGHDEIDTVVRDAGECSEAVPDD